MFLDSGSRTNRLSRLSKNFHVLTCERSVDRRFHYHQHLLCKQSPEAFYRKTKPQLRGDCSDIIVIDDSWVYLFANDIVLVCGHQINEAEK